jgi:cytochrome b561
MRATFSVIRHHFIDRDATLSRMLSGAMLNRIVNHR